MATVRTYSSCYMCAFDCPITVDSIGSEIVAIDHPGCVRATALREQRDNNRRLLHPQLRASAEDLLGVSGSDEGNPHAPVYRGEIQCNPPERQSQV